MKSLYDNVCDYLYERGWRDKVIGIDYEEGYSTWNLEKPYYSYTLVDVKHSEIRFDLCMFSREKDEWEKEISSYTFTSMDNFITFYKSYFK